MGTIMEAEMPCPEKLKFLSRVETINWSSPEVVVKPGRERDHLN